MRAGFRPGSHCVACVPQVREGGALSCRAVVAIRPVREPPRRDCKCTYEACIHRRATLNGNMPGGARTRHELTTRWWVQDKRKGNKPSTNGRRCLRAASHTGERKEEHSFCGRQALRGDMVTDPVPTMQKWPRGCSASARATCYSVPRHGIAVALGRLTPHFLFLFSPPRALIVASLPGTLQSYCMACKERRIPNSLILYFSRLLHHPSCPRQRFCLRMA